MSTVTSLTITIQYGSGTYTIGARTYYATIGSLSSYISSSSQCSACGSTLSACSVSGNAVTFTGCSLTTSTQAYTLVITQFTMPMSTQPVTVVVTDNKAGAGCSPTITASARTATTAYLVNTGSFTGTSSNLILKYTPSFSLANAYILLTPLVYSQTSTTGTSPVITVASSQVSITPVTLVSQTVYTFTIPYVTYGNTLSSTTSVSFYVKYPSTSDTKYDVEVATLTYSPESLTAVSFKTSVVSDVSTTCSSASYTFVITSPLSLKQSTLYIGAYPQIKLNSGAGASISFTSEGIARTCSTLLSGQYLQTISLASSCTYDVTGEVTIVVGTLINSIYATSYTFSLAAYNTVGTTYDSTTQFMKSYTNASIATAITPSI